MLLDKVEFLEEYGHTEEEIKSIDIDWDSLMEIYETYCSMKDEFDKIRKDFMDKFIVNNANNGLHSYSSRIKNEKHLISKIIRKLTKDTNKFGHNYPKYKCIKKDNFSILLTDLIGIKGLLLFREDWIKFHNFICEHFEENELYYKQFEKWENFESIPDGVMLEEPKVHIQNGDHSEIYQNIKQDNIVSGMKYRSIHYILKYSGHIIEIQVRTLFDEGWGEVDHELIYPRRTKNKMLGEYSELLSRLTGLADEMSSYFNRLIAVDPSNFCARDNFKCDDNNIVKSVGKSRSEANDTITQDSNEQNKENITSCEIGLNFINLINKE